MDARRSHRLMTVAAKLEERCLPAGQLGILERLATEPGIAREEVMRRRPAVSPEAHARRWEPAPCCSQRLGAVQINVDQSARRLASVQPDVHVWLEVRLPKAF